MPVCNVPDQIIAKMNNQSSNARQNTDTPLFLAEGAYWAIFRNQGVEGRAMPLGSRLPRFSGCQAASVSQGGRVPTCHGVPIFCWGSTRFTQNAVK